MIHPKDSHSPCLYIFNQIFTFSCSLFPIDVRRRDNRLRPGWVWVLCTLDESGWYGREAKARLVPVWGLWHDLWISLPPSGSCRIVCESVCVIVCDVSGLVGLWGGGSRLLGIAHPPPYSSCTLQCLYCSDHLSAILPKLPILMLISLNQLCLKHLEKKVRFNLASLCFDWRCKFVWILDFFSSINRKHTVHCTLNLVEIDFAVSFMLMLRRYNVCYIHHSS